MKRILFTGFERFGQGEANPTEALAEALDGMTIGGIEVISARLPVSMKSMPSALRKVIDETDPHAILMSGLWPGEPLIRLERLAINFAEFGIPDNDGAILSEDVSGEGPDALKCTWPVKRIEQAMLSRGIPARLSEHAGTFLCNAALYTALHHCADRDLPIGFMHVPNLPQQVSRLIQSVRAEHRIELYQRQDLASMALPVQLDAARIALEEIASVLEKR